ncbi:MAG: YkgJ family cysteine cluster protein [Desulfobulbus sp.]|jgi:Fe-S-cluster containining protein
MVEQAALTEGRERLRQPVLPLVSIVSFIYLTGDFAAVDEVLAELPDEIETRTALYRDPARMLHSYLDLLRPLADLKAGVGPRQQVLDEKGNTIDALSAGQALITQAVLTRELTAINSLCCAPCGCTLCCIGPDAAMAQHYFEIPLSAAEPDLFAVERIDTAASRATLADDEPSLCVGNHPFYQRTAPALIHWRRGWSLILPREARCPELDQKGRCRIYADRPQVCRMPQIFPYLLESDPDRSDLFHLRGALLAVTDCPYVQVLRDDIATYAAACELELILRRNKA